MRGRSNTEARPPRPTPTPLRSSIAIAALLALAAGGCRPEPAEIHDARPKILAFVAALRSKDETRLRSLAACVVETAGIRDARFRYFEAPRSIGLQALDSLSTRYAEAHRIADSLYTAAPDSASDLEARFANARSLAHRAATTRAALRAAATSASVVPGRRDRSATAGGPILRDADLRTLRAHVLVRYAGEAVGPDPIDRDTIVRLIRAPGGEWVVYAFDLASDPPGPLPY